MALPRVAFFPDSFHEVNGVAHTSRNFQAYARRHGIPFLCVRAGNEPDLRRSGSVTTLELRRSRFAVPLETDLSFDPLFWRHADRIEDAVSRFRPDVLHMTGPSELGIFATYLARSLGVPLAASWHTNVHEYAGRRMRWASAGAQGWAQRRVLAATAGFYRQARLLFAPNRELCQMLEERTGRPCSLMRRGVDTALFHPGPPRPPGGVWTIGYVGRLSVEKNVALLPRVARELEAAGVRARFLIVGQGQQQPMLRHAMPDAEFAGVLAGEALADAYRRMDVFCFPSHTDTFGNVVLEALASGVPAVVTPQGGPATIVMDGVTGSIAQDDAFGAAVISLLANRERLREHSHAARRYAELCSWDAVFDQVYAAYQAVAAAPLGSSTQHGACQLLC